MWGGRWIPAKPKVGKAGGANPRVVGGGWWVGRGGSYVACQRGRVGGQAIDDDRGGGVGGRQGPVSEVSVGGRLLRKEEYLENVYITLL